MPEIKDQELIGPHYWRSLDEKAETPEFKQWLEREFPVGASEFTGMDRRHFLKIMAASFGLAGLGLVGCRQPKQYIMPYAKQIERSVPGVPVYYASSMPTPRDNMPLVVESHESRPTKIEGNPSFKAYNGGTNSFAQASVLDLYDPDRMAYSTRGGEILSKAQVLDLIKETSDKYSKQGGRGLAFIAEQSSSPTRAKVVAQLKQRYPQALWAEYEPIDCDNPQKSLKKLTGRSLRPYYHFDKAKRVLSLDSNFLESEPGHIAYNKAFASLRRVESSKDAHKMNRLYMAESDFSITGGMADHRVRVSAAHMYAFTALVGAEILSQLGGSASLISRLKQQGQGIQVDSKWIKECAADLVKHKGESLLVAGSHLSEAVHEIVFYVNQQLNAVGRTLSLLQADEPAYKTSTLKEITDAISKNQIDTLVVIGGNPVYNGPADLNLRHALKQVPEVIRFGYYTDETSAVSGVHIASNHYLESWSDGLTWDGTYVPVQPVIMPLFEGFSELEFLARLSGSAETDPYALVKSTFHSRLPGGMFDTWLAEGVAPGTGFAATSVTISESNVARGKVRPPEKLSINNLEVRFVESTQVGDGRYNNNGWLQECPEAMTKLTWDNAITISPRLAKELEEAQGIALLPKSSVLNKTGQLVSSSAEFNRGKEKAVVAELRVGSTTIKGPIHIQPGLADYTVILPLGYGREYVGRVGKGTGFNAYPLRSSLHACHVVGGQLNLTSERYMLANTQEHWSMEGRAIIREANADDYEKHPHFVDKMGMESHSPPVYGKEKDQSLAYKVTENPRGNSLYESPEATGLQQWGMVIDLNTCTGCNACVVACQSENNIAIVGKDQVLRGREMHWIRLDRYYSSGSDDRSVLPEDPQVSFMGMLCQQCQLAPCEMVCPVNATVHDEEGLNVMAYNRCVGTRYCANNCPYKVRRFNFFDWNKREIGHFYEGPLGPAGVPETQKMQKNPDVTVRMRGVMEKCTYCVQRIEEAKINQRVKAKGSDNVKVPDGTIQVACQQVCPTESIVFGDITDPNSKVAKLKNNDRDYSVLGYLNTRPRTTYLAKLRNPNPMMPDFKDQPLSRMEYEKRYGHNAHGHHSAAAHQQQPAALAH